MVIDFQCSVDPNSRTVPILSSSSLDSLCNAPMKEEPSPNVTPSTMADNKDAAIPQPERELSGMSMHSYTVIESTQTSLHSEGNQLSRQPSQSITPINVTSGSEQSLGLNPHTATIPINEIQQHAPIHSQLNTTVVAPDARGLHPGDPGLQPSLAQLENRPLFQLDSQGNVISTSASSTNTIPEFLYQLNKMLTDNNRDIIEWNNGMFKLNGIF